MTSESELMWVRGYLLRASSKRARKDQARFQPSSQWQHINFIATRLFITKNSSTKLIDYHLNRNITWHHDCCSTCLGGSRLLSGPLLSDCPFDRQIHPATMAPVAWIQPHPRLPRLQPLCRISSMGHGSARLEGL